MNWDVFQGAAIALLSLGGGALVGEFLTRRADRRDRRLQFSQSTLLDLQTTIGDMAIAAEQVLSGKRESSTWTGDVQGPAWDDLIRNAVLSSRYSVLIAAAEH